ncbi:ornithine cyclodeaminase family protein [Thermoproteus tenax]|uniref:Ornithine cyclodeaminase n=1 Tax=Thermoproteus tenax (strain ATCC 35583 / DSM 2078 / JCM 9277 / NBRC 100435 / Kra 1) TaxID=768679 RepID=G4RM88_THETK|nr:ornithine cyclodeaminase family protein [Thermoproteus tenax]CCC82683.1 ornithine cyclodeaminase [Thermoproteus tenax Kra 1]
MLLIEDVDSLVDPAKLVEDIAVALKAERVVLPRRALQVSGLWFAPMAAYVRGMGLGAKLVGIFPRGSPPVRALSVLFDAETGEILAAADGTKLTGWRTAAASALAARLLGVTEGAIVGIIGAGVQAEYHARVFRALFKPSKIFIYSRRRAAELAGRLGLVQAPLEAVMTAEVIIAATNSQEPVIKGALLRRDAVVISVGAPRPVRELDEDTKRRASCALIDSPEAAEETDDVAGLKTTTLESALSGAEICRGEIKLYKSVGYAPFDVAAIYHVYRRALELGRGRSAHLG